MAKFLDYNGLLYFWGKICANFVSDITYDSNEGKLIKTKNKNSYDLIGLASDSSPGLMSSNDKQTLENIITTGGEPNQNAFSTFVVGDTSIVADSKTDTITLLAGDNVTLSSTASSDTFKISAVDTKYTSMTTAQAATGTSTTARSISAKTLAKTIDDRIQAAQMGSSSFQGAVNNGSDISNLTSYSRGQYWVVATSGVYVGQTCEAGDMIFCINDYSSSFSNSDFNVVQNNLDLQAISNNEINTIVSS